MPLAPVDNSGTHLYYDDTGAPLECAEYRTLVLIHGAIFNGGECQLEHPRNLHTRELQLMRSQRHSNRYALTTHSTVYASLASICATTMALRRTPTVSSKRYETAIRKGNTQ